jgi:release factor glutamine methyltransferase
MIKPGSTAAQALDTATRSLRTAGCQRPDDDARVLLAEALRTEPSELTSKAAPVLENEVAERASSYLVRRAEREPLEYILGRCLFRGMTILVDDRVMVPRPESALLISAALELGSGKRVHDVGTGSGAVALAIKAERRDLIVSASDISAAAIDLARANAARLSLPIRLTVAAGVPPGQYDLVVGLLPFLPEGEAGRLPREASDYEPRLAHTAGPDGLDVIRSVIAGTPRGTLMALAHAPWQGERVRGLLTESVTRDVGCPVAHLTTGTC